MIEQDQALLAELADSADGFAPLPIDLTQTFSDGGAPTLQTRALHKQHHDAVHAAVNRLEQQIRPLLLHLSDVAQTAQQQVAASDAEHAGLRAQIQEAAADVQAIQAQLAQVQASADAALATAEQAAADATTALAAVAALQTATSSAAPVAEG